MEARFCGAARPLAMIAATLVGSLLSIGMASAAGYRTTNFTVAAPTAALAKEIGDSAEVWRKQLALEWLGKELPRWSEPCPIKATVAPQLGAGGATSFVFDQGQVFGWRMNIQGSRERVLDSVLPHEITHTIFATHFRRPLPRWADEGACTTVEHVSEISKQERMLLDFLHAAPGHPGRGIPFDDMFVMTEYPEDVLPLYAQGHSLSVYLIGQKGKREFLNYLADGMSHGDWRRATREHYGYDHLLALQNSWLDWVKAGRPALTPPADGSILAGEPGLPTPPSAPATFVAAAPGSAVPASYVSTPVVRGQSPSAQTASAAAPGPSPDDSAAITPTAGPNAASAGYGDWATRPVRHTMNASPGEAIGAPAGGSWR